MLFEFIDTYSITVLSQSVNSTCVMVASIFKKQMPPLQGRIKYYNVNWLFEFYYKVFLTSISS